MVPNTKERSVAHRGCNQQVYTKKTQHIERREFKQNCTILLLDLVISLLSPERQIPQIILQNCFLARNYGLRGMPDAKFQHQRPHNYRNFVISILEVNTHHKTQKNVI